MANAVLSTPVGTKIGTFIVNVSIDPSTGIDESDFVLRGLRENGIAGVGFELSDITANTDFNLSFTLPDNKEGSFSVEMTGMVTPQGSSIPEAVTSNTLEIVYDTTANVSMTLGEPRYEENGVIIVPITFVEAVIAPSKTIFDVKRVKEEEDSDGPADPSLDGIAYAIFRKGESDTDFDLVLTVPPDHPSRRLRIETVGDVLKASTGVWDNVIATPITVPYLPIVPKPEDFEFKGDYRHGKPYMVRVKFNTRVTGWHQNNTLTRAEREDEAPSVWINEGAELGMMPTPYKWNSMTPLTDADFHGDEPLISVVTQGNSLAMNVAVDAVHILNIDEFFGVGPIEITNSAAGAGAYTVRGVDENGGEQTETLTFGASDDTMTTTNNFRSAGLEIEVVTAFAAATTASIEVDTVDFAEGNWERLNPPPPGDPTPGMNNFDNEGNWHGEEAQFFLIFWNAVDPGAVGNVNLIFRPDGPIRGPVS